MEKAYRVEWLHNGNWRMEVNDIGIFNTLQEAQKAIEKDYKGMTTRIVEAA